MSEVSISTSPVTTEKPCNKTLVVVLIIIIAVLVLFIIVIVAFPAIRCPSTFGFLIRSAFSKEGCVYILPVPPEPRVMFRERMNNNDSIFPNGCSGSDISLNIPMKIANSSVTNKQSSKTETFYVFVNDSNVLGNLLLTNSPSKADLFVYNGSMLFYGKDKAVIRGTNKKLFIETIQEINKLTEEEKKADVYWKINKGTITDYNEENVLSVVSYVHVKEGNKSIDYYLIMIPKENKGKLECSWTFM